MTAAAPRRWQRLAWWGLWLGLCVLLVGRAASRRPSRGVILDHLEFGRRILHGEDVYGPWRSDPDAPVRPLHAPYPPSFGLLVAPFHLVDRALGLRAARLAWALLQVGCLVALAVGLRRLAAPRAPPQPLAASQGPWPWLWLGTFVLGARFVLRDTHGGGGNLVNAALAVLAFLGAERGQPWRAGLCLGFSLATKPTQLWLLPVFLALGHRRAAGAAVATGLAAAAATLALQRFDLGPWLRWLEGSYRIGVQADPFAVPALDFPPFEWMNQSLRFALARWCGEVPPEFAARVPWGVSPGLGLGPAAVAWLGRAANLGLLAALLAVGWRTRHAAAARALTLAAALVLSVLLSPLSWKAHHVALLPGLGLLLHHAVAKRSRGTAWLLAAFGLACALPGGDLVGDAADEWLNSLYVVTAFDLLLFAALLHRARSAAHEHGDAALPGGAGELRR